MNKDEEERVQARAIHGPLFGEIKHRDGEREWDEALGGVIKQAGREGNEKESRDNSLLNRAGWTAGDEMDEGKRRMELRAWTERRECEREKDIGNENKQAIIHPIPPLLLSSP